MPKRGTFWDYVKEAFNWRYNLLALGAGTVFAFLSLLPMVVLPLLAAAEIAYLGLLSTNPRFRKAIDLKFSRGKTKVERDQQLKQILAVLPERSLQRFEDLRDRCATLNRLGHQFRGPEAPIGNLDDMHVGSLDRLLWMFLKLLYSSDAISRFLRNTDRDGLTREIQETEEYLKRSEEKGRAALVRSLTDKLATVQSRLTNYDDAEENAEVIDVELDRIEQKITAISEMSIHTKDPASISVQVDGIADSISATADAIRELDVVPDLEYDEAPAFLREEA